MLLNSTADSQNFVDAASMTWVIKVRHVGSQRKCAPNTQGGMVGFRPGVVPLPTIFSVKRRHAGRLLRSENEPWLQSGGHVDIYIQNWINHFLHL